MAFHGTKRPLRTQELEALGKDRSKPEWLFCNETGNMLDADNVRHRVFYKLLETTGLRRIRIYDLRHTFATRLLMNGESPAYVKEQMGHSSIQVTVDLYCHWIPGSNRQAVDRLDEGMKIPKLEGQSATIRNQTRHGQVEEERFPWKYPETMEPATRIERATCDLQISDSSISDYLTPQETTNQDAPDMGADGGD